jgi:hypothetical protein
MMFAFDPMLQAYHDLAHDAPHDFETTVMVALTQRDIAVIGTGLRVCGHVLPCLDEERIGLIERLSELIGVQHPEWGVDYEEPDSGEEA